MTLQEDMDELRLAWRTFLLTVADALGIPRFMRWLSRRLA